MDDRSQNILHLPHALRAVDQLRARLGGRAPALFLDYDGVLTPIVDDPAAATLDPDGRAAVQQAAEQMPVAIISGRDLNDVRSMVAVDHLAYAGSHGFDMLLADGQSERYGEDFLGELEEVEQELREQLRELDGVHLERKGFAATVHTRQARAPEFRERAQQIVAAMAQRHPRLKLTGGKEVEEFRPGIEWDKGRALTRLMTVLGLDDAEYAPIYVGDDVTDEDAFAAIADTGVGVVVAGEENRPTRADFRLDEPAETAALLRMLTTLAQEHTGAQQHGQ